MNQINLGIIGTGALAHKVHLPSLVVRDDVNLVAICDINQRRVEMTSRTYRVREKFSDYKKMIERISLDAVLVVTPPKVTAEVALYCLSRGLDTFMEKSPGTNLEETRELAQAAKDNACKAMVGFNRRFCPLVRKAKAMVEEKGQIVQVLVNFHKPAFVEDDLIRDIIHAIDMLRYMCGEPRQLFSKVSQFYGDKDNSFNSVIEFENSSVGILSCYRTSGVRYERFEIHGKNIAAYIRPPQYARAYDGQRCVLLEESKIASFYHAFGFFDEVDHFIEAVKQDREIKESSIFDALKTMRLATAIRKFQNQGLTPVSRIDVSSSS